jgi:hypothetical protein
MIQSAKRVEGSRFGPSCVEPTFLEECVCQTERVPGRRLPLTSSDLAKTDHVVPPVRNTKRRPGNSRVETFPGAACQKTMSYAAIFRVILRAVRQRSNTAPLHSTLRTSSPNSLDPIAPSPIRSPYRSSWLVSRNTNIRTWSSRPILSCTVLQA